MSSKHTELHSSTSCWVWQGHTLLINTSTVMNDDKKICVFLKKQLYNLKQVFLFIFHGVKKIVKLKYLGLARTNSVLQHNQLGLARTFRNVLRYKQLGLKRLLTAWHSLTTSPTSSNDTNQSAHSNPQVRTYYFLQCLNL